MTSEKQKKKGDNFLSVRKETEKDLRHSGRGGPPRIPEEATRSPEHERSTAGQEPLRTEGSEATH